MKIFQKRWVAVLLTVLMIGMAAWIGHMRADKVVVEPVPDQGTVDPGLNTNLSTSDYEKWILDESGVLSERAYKQICLYNANWVQRYDSLIAVAVMKNVDEDLFDWAVDTAGEIELARTDGLLVIDTSDGEVQLVVGNDYPLSDSQITDYTTKYMADEVGRGDYSGAILNLFDGLNTYYVDHYGLGNAGGTSTQAKDGAGIGILTRIIVCVIVLLVIANLMDRWRYARYRRRYYGMVQPPVLFRPILFWHGPTYGWYRRRWNQPPPPSGPRGPRGPGNRSGGFGGPSSRGGSSSFRGGGFRSSKQGGSFRGSASGSFRSSGFGGSASRGSGGFRGGGFRGGGGRGGGFR